VTEIIFNGAGIQSFAMDAGAALTLDHRSLMLDAGDNATVLNGSITLNNSAQFINKATFSQTGALTVGTTTAAAAGSVENDGTWNVGNATTSATETVNVAFTGTGAVTIAHDSALAFGGNVSAGQTITFADATGRLTLNAPASFSGTIAGFTGTDPAHSDAIILTGIDFNSSQFASSYNSATGVLSVTDGVEIATLKFTGFTGTFAFSDLFGDTLITDPPTPPLQAATEPQIETLPTENALDGSITFAAGGSLAPIASFAPLGQDYVGTFTLDGAISGHDGASVEFHFALGNGEAQVAPGQAVTQSYAVGVADGQGGTQSQTVSVSIGGPGADNFVFKPGVGADTILNFKPQQDTIELDNFADVHTVEQLVSAITSDAHGNATIALGHGDSITIAGMTDSQFHAIAQSAIHLH
jgi:hypothetical protein